MTHEPAFDHRVAYYSDGSFWSSPFILRKLGKHGSVAVERLTGMLLIMISVQMLLDGFKDYMHIP